MTGWKRWFYYNMGWEYPNDPTEETKRQRHEVMVQIRSYGDNIKDIVLREEGEIPKVKATRCPTPTIDLGVLHNHNDFLDGTECDAPTSIPDYTALLEGIDLRPKKKKRRKRRNSNKLNF